MAAPLHQPQTRMVDPPEEDQELTATELAQVVGGADGPGNPGNEGPYETASGRVVIITVPS